MRLPFLNFRLPAATAVGPPRFLFLQLNQRCNLRCQHCVYWTLNDDDRAHYLSRDRRRELITELAELNPHGAVVIFGGESKLDLDDYFALTTDCRANGLRCLSVINGTRIRDAALADRMIREGPTEISVSLNSHLPAEHDRTRGVPGAFTLATNAVRLLRAARERHPSPGGRLYVMGLIHEDNYRQLDAFYDFVLHDLRADKLKLNFLQPTFGLPGGADEFFAAHHIRDADALLAVLRACNAKYQLGLNPEWLRVVEMYCRSVRPDGARQGWNNAAGTAEAICNTYERNIMVDLYGNARLCFSGEFPQVPLRARGDLARFWHGQAAPIRCQMKDCRRPCGISHSVRREPATLASRGR